MGELAVGKALGGHADPVVSRHLGPDRGQIGTLTAEVVIEMAFDVELQFLVGLLVRILSRPAVLG